ncbi:hypothetical protein LWP59_26655 [Amycolatopsis acidiphila]|uniref:Uncharacterized protein n=1 Tax=Amycolatopsis acidiphila TaxID=715473 RepID=A0A558AIN4_9PSEU|nr:hypothetical protein [Amycolatopsis acidiphila]TVT24128.1 hypothetical protein FNH06_08005 [Amycolatopsis acidiphila]UIJ57708.1 hypothetical protein LWP59_26655 [Amycolatopsis acidiphila]GHG87207.1 hypothetical protein GCM10017788_60670 [Amycolatopsis acidiphila]
MTTILLCASGVVLIVLSILGRRNVAGLVSRSLEQEHRLRQERVLRRGMLTCRMVGVVFLVSVVLGLLGTGPVRP